jgi:hypothetical protein
MLKNAKISPRKKEKFFSELIYRFSVRFANEQGHDSADS